MRILAMPYSILCYFLGVGALVGLVLFIGDFLIPVTINKPSPIAPNFSPAFALLWNSALIVLWGLQHSIMADNRFKAWWTRFVHPAVERSTFLLFVALATTMLIILWNPVPIVIWKVDNPMLEAILVAGYFSGWAIVLGASFLINHFQLFGLEQAYRMLTSTQSKKSIFVTPFLYRIVRHPIMTGVLISLWFAPEMTVGRLGLNLVMTTYILIGTRHEEKTLVEELGKEYEDYQKTTPMLIPNIGTRKSEEQTTTVNP